MADVAVASIVINTAGLHGALLPEVVKDIERRCITVERVAKRLVRVDTGRLRASIDHKVEPVGTDVVGTVGSGAAESDPVSYAAIIEFRYPYLRPALEAAKQ